jgi:nitroreductase
VVRKFQDRALESRHLNRILNAGRRTGSSKNEQTWTFIAVQQGEALHALTAVGRYADHLDGAAAAIALVGPDTQGWRAATTMWDLGRAAQNMVLAAWDLGVGSAPATVFDHELAARLLGLPDGQRCNFILSFGYPADPSTLTRPNKRGGRKALERVVREEHW